MSGEAEGTIAQRLPAWTRIPPQQLLAILMVVATALALVIGGWMWSTAPDYKVLFSNLSDKDGGAVVAALQQANVPYKFAEGGGAILVPSEHVHDLRLKLASQGLPKGGLVGLELMEGQRFGASQFLEQVNYQRGLEGELARSIQTIQAVASARIHLALPRGTAFLREQAKPSASVLVHLHPGRTLEQAQVASIVHLVSNSVPDLTTKNVTVVDQNGNLLSTDANAQGPTVDTKQLKYRQETEQSFIKRIEAILAPVLGAANVRAQVSADLDFSEVEQAEELYKPNGKPEEAAVRTSQTSEQSGPANNGGASGVPGALTNQPPQSGGAPIQTAADPNAPPAAGTPGPSGNSRKESAVTYEVDKSIRHTRIAQGRIKRLSVAVVVNNKQVTDAKGKVTTVPLNDAEKTQITDLVKGVMGYDKDRGDTLSVINSAFSAPEAEKVADVPMWKDPSIIGMAKEGGKYLLYAALVLFILMKLKPMVANILKPAPPVVAPVQIAAPVEGELVDDEPPAKPDRYETTLENAKQIAKQDPAVVANVVKNWVAGQ